MTHPLSERLRDWKRDGNHLHGPHPLSLEAADAIDALQAKVERMEAALRGIAEDAYVPLSQLPDAGQPNGWRSIAVERIDKARAALNEQADQPAGDLPSS